VESAQALPHTDDVIDQGQSTEMELQTLIALMFDIFTPGTS